MLTDISASSNVVYITFGGDASDKIGITQLTPVTYSFNPDGTILTLIVNNIEYQIDFSGLTIGGVAPADVAAAYTALSTVFPAAGGGGGSSLFPVTGTGTATGDVIAELSGYTLSIRSSTVGSTPNLLINPGSYFTDLRSLAPGGLSSLLELANDGDGSRFELNSNNGSTQVDIYGDADAQTIKMTAANGLVQPTPASTTAALLANGQISFYLDEVGNNLKVAVKYSDGTTKTGTVVLV